MKNKRVYISGGITNELYYMENFSNAERELIKMGYIPINPTKICKDLPTDTTHDEYMKVCITLLDMCSSIYMLHGWQKSKGATQEKKYATRKRKYIMYETR